MKPTLAHWLRAMRPDPTPPASAEPPEPGACAQTWPTHACRYAPVRAMGGALVQALVYMASSSVLPHSVAVLLALTAGVLLGPSRSALTAAQFFDGPPRGPTPTLGAAGALALLLMTLLRLETLANIEPDWFAVSVVCAAGVSQALGVVVLASVPRRALQTHTDAPALRPVSMLDALIALGSATVPLVLISAWTGEALTTAVGAGAALLAGALARRVFKTRLHTLLDARVAAVVQQVAEIAALLGMLGMLGLDTEALTTEDEGS